MRNKHDSLVSDIEMAAPEIIEPGYKDTGFPTPHTLCKHAFFIVLMFWCNITHQIYHSLFILLLLLAPILYWGHWLQLNCNETARLLNSLVFPWEQNSFLTNKWKDLYYIVNFNCRTSLKSQILSPLHKSPVNSKRLRV